MHRAENGADEASVSRGSARGQINRRTLEKQPIPALGCRSKFNWMALISEGGSRQRKCQKHTDSCLRGLK